MKKASIILSLLLSINIMGVYAEDTNDVQPTTDTPVVSNETQDNGTPKTDTTDIKDNIDTDTIGTLELANITIEGYPINFSPSMHEYSVEVENSVTSIKINVEKKDEMDTVVIMDTANNLLEGKNIVTINVSNATGENGTYVLYVTRARQLSANNYLGILQVPGYDLGFDPNVKEYTLQIESKVKVLEIKAIPESEKAQTPVITGNANLKNGSVISIKIEAENGDINEYKIKIVKKFNIKDYMLYIIIVLIIGIGAGVYLFIKKQKEKEAKKIKPEVTALPNTTAGTIQEVKETVEETNVPQEVTIGEAKLEIITPTNVEIEQSTNVTPVQPVQETTSSTPVETFNSDGVEDNTEVFKL